MTTTAPSVTSLSRGDWCPGGASSFHTSFADPGGSAAGMVRWALQYLYPLNDWLDQLIGDEAQVASLARDWASASADLDAITDESYAALSAIAELQGHSIRALRATLQDVRETSTYASDWARATARSLALASTIVTAVHDAVAGALSELVAIATSLLDYSLPSLNPFDKWDKLKTLVNHVDKFVRVIEQLIDRMFDAFSELIALLHALQPLIAEATSVLRQLMARIVDAAGMPIGAIVGIVGGGSRGAMLGAPFGPLGVAGGTLLGGLAGGGFGMVLGDSIAGAAADWMSATPTVRELDESDMASPRDALPAYHDAMMARELTSLTDFVTADGYVDSMGRTERTVIDVKKVVAADGTKHWVVTLPSTQDWNLLRGVKGGRWDDILADYPATNDLDTNVALMLSDHPELATRYQRGVYEAMQQAGVPAGAPVVYSGFSQGGIMSAALAADTHSQYQPIGIVTVGAPVDRFDIPQDVKVIAFAHASDPVAMIDEALDITGRAMEIEGHAFRNPLEAIVGSSLQKGHAIESTIGLPNPSAVPGGETPGIHSIPGYSQTVSAWEAQNPQAAADAVTLMGGTILDHQLYAFHE